MGHIPPLALPCVSLHNCSIFSYFKVSSGPVTLWYKFCNIPFWPLPVKICGYPRDWDLRRTRRGGYHVRLSTPPPRPSAPGLGSRRHERRNDNAVEEQPL